MTPGEVLQRGREFAEQANDLHLRHWVDHLLVFGRVAECEVHSALVVVATAPVETCSLGLVVVRWTRVSDALAMSTSGWAVARVGFGQRLVGPLPGDIALARERLRALGLDITRPLYEQAP